MWKRVQQGGIDDQARRVLGGPAKCGLAPAQREGALATGGCVQACGRTVGDDVATVLVVAAGVGVGGDAATSCCCCSGGGRCRCTCGGLGGGCGSDGDLGSSDRGGGDWNLLQGCTTGLGSGLGGIVATKADARSTTWRCVHASRGTSTLVETKREGAKA